MTDFQRDDKTAFIARKLAPEAAADSSPHKYTVRLALPASSTLQGWQNPHAGQVVISNVLVTFTTAGAGGTVDIGTGTAGTAANDAIVNGGTMAAISYTSLKGTGAGTGDIASAVLLGGSGSAADSIGVQHDEGVTSTAVGVVFFDVHVL
jgi:hypothetical protein